MNTSVLLAGTKGYIEISDKITRIYNSFIIYFGNKIQKPTKEKRLFKDNLFFSKEFK